MKPLGYAWPRLLFLAMLIGWGGGCSDPGEETKLPYKKTVEPRSKLVLYTPTFYAVSPTFSSVSGAGFRLEDPKRETLGAVLEISADLLNLSSLSGGDSTSATNAISTMHGLTARFRTHIAELLPFADPDERVGDWSLITLNSGLTKDLRGNHVAYAHYSLRVAPIYQLRSPEVVRYMARLFLAANWADFPRNDAAYFPAGQNIVDFVIAVSIHNDVGYANDSNRVGLSFAAVPNNTSTINSIADIDDIIAFKTLGNIRDKLVTQTKTFKVGRRGEPVDMIVALDGNQTMREEAPSLKTTMVDLISQLSADTSFDYRIAFLTNGSSEFIRFADGSRYLSADSKKPEDLAGLALDAIFDRVNEDYTPRNDLLRRAVLAITEPAISTTNAGFNRANAPLLLIYISDRDDDSPSPDNSALGSTGEFATGYAGWLGGYDHWIAYVPNTQGCKSNSLNTAASADKTLAVANIFGATVIDMCSYGSARANDAIVAWGAENGSSFRFAPPQPMAFTLKVSLNGTRLSQSGSMGYIYDFIGDRFQFSNVTTPHEGDEVGASYLTLEAPVIFEKR